jgi:SAM-dependent methyltransferase
MPKPPSRVAALVYRYRTEHDTPIRQAFAIGLGLYIGASPFVGFHLALSLALGWMFGLNRFRVYFAANISNPLVAPFLYALEIQVGSWLRTGHVLTVARLHEVRLQGLAIDILLGSVVVGLSLAAAGTALTYWGSGARRGSPEETRLVVAAAERYLSVGIGAWEFARSKLRFDPVYLQVLRDGRLPQRGRLMDLGCGQGLMLALIATAADEWRRGRWPASWPPPPEALELNGIETRPRVARRARAALDGAATISEIDLTAWLPPPCDAVLLVDVLHLLSREVQDRLIDGVARAMPPGGVLIVREADAAAGWKFNAVRFGNRFNALWQGKFRRRFCFDSVAGWTERLARAGFDVESVTRHDSGPFGNVLLQARLGRGSAGQTG